MEERRAADFRRLSSDGTSHSSQSLDSCEYYQLEIFEQLPSVQASRPGLNTLRLVDGTCGAHRGVSADSGDRLGHAHRSLGRKNKASTQPLRNLPMCIQGKRGARERRNMQTSSVGFWDAWRRSQSISRRRLWEHAGGALRNLLPWQHALHTIEGRFGMGVKAYFVFLRYLVYLNLVHCALIGAFVLGPTAFYGRSNHSEPLSFTGNDSVLDFFMGTGYLDRSPVFFGFYTRGSLNRPCLNTPLLYYAGILSIFLLSLVLVVRRISVGYKHTFMLGKRYGINMSYKIFCGWEFTIQDPEAAALKRSFIRNDLKLFLEEQSFSLKESQRSVGQKVRLYLLRGLLNLLVLSLLAGAFSLLYFSTRTSLYQSDHHWLLGLVLQYLPPLTITFVNLVLPHIFRKISSFEDYSLTTQINATLLRSIFLKLASLGFYLIFIYTTNNNQQLSRCQENQFGREVYKLCIFNFLAVFCSVFLWNLPWKLVQERFPSSLPARLLGKQYFLIPFNVLDLVYAQTVSWVGVYYCPLLPLIGTVTLVATFYIKKFSVLRCCDPEQRLFRASSSSVLFHFMLLPGLIMAASTLGLNLHQQNSSSRWSCGPSGDGNSVFNVTEACVNVLPPPAPSVLRYLSSEAFVLPLLLAEIVVLTSYVSRGRANQKAVERLQDMLVMSCSDKRFLVRQHATILRSGKKNRRDTTPLQNLDQDQDQD